MYNTETFKYYKRIVSSPGHRYLSLYFFIRPKEIAHVNQGYNYSFSSFQLWNESLVSYISEQNSKTLAAADSLVWDPDWSSYQSIS